MDKITVVCHKDHDKGYEDYVGKCLLCEVERLQKREWVGIEPQEIGQIWANHKEVYGFGIELEQVLKERNT